MIDDNLLTCNIVRKLTIHDFQKIVNYLTFSMASVNYLTKMYMNQFCIFVKLTYNIVRAISNVEG